MTSDSVPPHDRDADAGSPPLGWIPIVGFSAALGLMLVPLPLEGRAGAATGDIAHAPMFGCLTIAVLVLWHRLRPLPAQGRDFAARMAVVGGGVFLLGVLIEFAQMMTGRHASLDDVIANGLGIAASLALCFAFLNSRQRRRCSVLAIGLATLLLGLATAGPIRTYLDILDVHRSFPLIASFEGNMELTRWHFDDAQGQYTDQNVTQGARAMRVLLDRAPHPAATLIETVSDWSAVQTLELDITLARSYRAPLEVILKVIDRHHSNYDTDVAQKSFRLHPGELTHLALSREEMVNGPETRTLELSQIKFISLLVVAPETATFMDVDHIRVTR